MLFDCSIDCLHPASDLRIPSVVKAFAEYYINMRMALGDLGSGGVTKFRNESLDGALMSVVEMGIGPRGVAVNDAKTGFDPAPSTPDARGYLIFQAALFMVGGQRPVSIKTRALQTRIDPLERMSTIDYLRRQIQKLEKSGDPHGTGGAKCFGVWADLENELVRETTPEQVI